MYQDDSCPQWVVQWTSDEYAKEGTMPMHMMQSFTISVPAEDIRAFFRPLRT